MNMLIIQLIRGFNRRCHNYLKSLKKITLSLIRHKSLKSLNKDILSLMPHNSLRSLNKNILSLIDDANFDEATRLCREGLQKYPKSIRVNECLTVCLDVLQEHEEAIFWAENSARLRIKRIKKRLKDEILEEAQQKGLQKHQRIFASGYFKSGSSALVDYLRGLDRTKKWTPYGEMRLIKTPGGIRDFSEKYYSGEKTEAILNLYLTIVGRKLTTTKTWNNSNRISRKLISNQKCSAYILECLQFWLKLKSSPAKSVEEFNSYSVDFLNKAFNHAAHSYNADNLIIDQAINAWRLHLARFVPPSTFFVVNRDPRDHFAESRYHWMKLGKKRQTVEEYIRKYRKIRNKSIKQAKKMSKLYGHKFFFYSFEDFVYDHVNSAKKLKDDLGLIGSSNSYDPELSKKNIGKFVNVLTRHERSLIESELKDFLHPAAG